VGQFYQNFQQVSDDDVIGCLDVCVEEEINLSPLYERPIDSPPHSKVTVAPIVHQIGAEHGNSGN